MDGYHDAFAKSLKSDRIIKIHVGSQNPEEEPYLVQQLALEATSDYFKTALDPKNFQEGRDGTLLLPKDDKEAWKIFLFWIFNRKLAHVYNGYDQIALIRCWCMAHKYNIVLFQNHVMWCLLHWYNRNHVEVDDASEALVNAPANSALCQLMVEEVVLLFRMGQWNPEHLNDIEGEKFLGQFMQELKRREGAEVGMIDRGASIQEKFNENWGKYMIGGQEKIPFDCDDALKPAD